MLHDFVFHHIGYAVKQIEKTAEYYINAGWKLSDIQIDPIQNAKIAFLFRENFPLIELVAPIDDFSPIVKTLEKSGISPYHICYEVNDINIAMQDLRQQKYIPLFNPVPAIALENRMICFLYHKDIGLIEILEKSNL